MTEIQSAKDSFGYDNADLLVGKIFQVDPLKFHLKRGRNLLPIRSGISHRPTTT